MQITALPEALPIFPLTGAVLLPEGRLPLNIFEPRYLAMVEDALGQGRMIGMIQPTVPEDEQHEPPVSQVGCAGRIVNFAETDDGRYMITLHGVCRFKVASALDGKRGYRRMKPDWTPFLSDLSEDQEPALDRPRLLDLLGPYLHTHNMEFDRKRLDGASDRMLVMSLSMSCPFPPREKQALLECADATARGQTLIALMELAIADGGSGSSQTRQ